MKHSHPEITRLLKAVIAQHGGMTPYGREGSADGIAFMIGGIPATFSVISSVGSGRYDVQIESSPPGDYIWAGQIGLDDFVALIAEYQRPIDQWPSESFAAVEKDWQERRLLETTLGETLEYLRSCHRRAPLLFFNGNTFADIARTFSDYLFAELPHGRRREVWRPKGSRSELIALPESLLREKP